MSNKVDNPLQAAGGHAAGGHAAGSTSSPALLCETPVEVCWEGIEYTVTVKDEENSAGPPCLPVKRPAIPYESCNFCTSFVLGLVLTH